MVDGGKELSYSLVRQFVVAFYNLDMADLMLTSAMRAPQDDLFIQDRASADWQLLDSNTTRHELKNAIKY